MFQPLQSRLPGGQAAHVSCAVFKDSTRTVPSSPPGLASIKKNILGAKVHGSLPNNVYREEVLARYFPTAHAQGANHAESKATYYLIVHLVVCKGNLPLSKLPWPNELCYCMLAKISRNLQTTLLLADHLPSARQAPELLPNLGALELTLDPDMTS